MTWSFGLIMIVLVAQAAGGSIHTVRAAPLVAPGPGPKPPIVTLSVPSTVLLGQNVSFTVGFDNESTDTPGYGPFLDILIDTTGPDGFYPGTSAVNAYDGLGILNANITAFYLGNAFTTSGSNPTMWIRTLNASGQATHPLARDSSGNYLIVDAFAQGFRRDDKLIVLKLPFGSFAPDQPSAIVNVTVSMSNLTDVGTDLPILARGGYQFGYTPLDDWCCGTPPDSADLTLSTFVSDDVTPTLWSVSKSYNGPENETATGPNFMRQYTVTATIAPGQSLTDFVLRDIFPNNLQFDHMVNTGGATCTTPSTTSPGGQIECTFPGSISGSPSFTFAFYVPRDDSTPVRVIDRFNGNDVPSCNDVTSNAWWLPIDTRDRPVVPPGDPRGIEIQFPNLADPAICEHILDDKSIAIQKDYTIVGGGNPIPGTVVEYTLNVQISDFFAFNNLIVTDVISDGQHVDSTFTPRIQIAGFPLLADTAMEPAAPALNWTYDVACNYSIIPPALGPGPECTTDNTTPLNDGKTTVTFRISQEIINRLLDLNGRMVGGCVNPGGGSADPDCSTHNHGATTATITYRSVIQNIFTDDYLPPGRSGDPSVDQGDILNNDVTVAGDLLATDTFTHIGYLDEEDGSSENFNIATGSLRKAVYAISSDGGVSWTYNPASPVQIKPGDLVTYRVSYNLPTSDEEKLTFTDYLPLPIFHVGDPDEDGAVETWTFSSAASGTPPAPGVVALLLAPLTLPAAPDNAYDTFYQYMVAGLPPVGTSGTLTAWVGNPGPTVDPVVSADTTNNSITISYATYDDTRHTATKVHLLFTLTVSDDPFADQLYLTNQVHASEGATNAPSVASDAIQQVILTEPVIVGKKSVVWSDNPVAAFSPTFPAPPHNHVIFQPPASTPRWTGTIDATYLSDHDLNKNISQVDAGDTITFAIVIQNTGSSLKGAFDITLKDTFPAPFEYTSLPLGLNLKIAYGNGTSIYNGGPSVGIFHGVATVGDCTGPGTPNNPCGPDNTPDTPDDIFGWGIQLEDPNAPDHGICQTHDPLFVNDVILITYDLKLPTGVTPGTITNTETLLRYAGTDGGPNFVPTPSPLTETATTSIISVPSKYLISTTAAHTPNTPAPAKVTIGEIIRYRLVASIPEGSSSNFQIRDLLPNGLTYLDDGTASVAFVSTGGITSTDVGTLPVLAIPSGPPGPGSCNLAGASANDTTPASLPCLLDDSNVGINNSTATDNDTPSSYTTGLDPYFKLGNLVNNDSDDDVEYVVIEFNALVDNTVTGSNDNGDDLPNRSRTYINGSQSGSDSSIVHATVVEPVLQIDKAVSDASPGAGEVVTFTLTVNHVTHIPTDPADSATTAFDMNIVDNIPNDLTLDLPSLQYSLAGGATGWSSNSTVNKIDVTIGTMPVGGSVTITFQATVKTSVPLGTTINNTASVVWTSLPGSDANERTGTGGAPNDYNDSDLQPLDVLRDLSKILFGTNQTFTTDAQVAIGEIVTYEVVLTIPPGTTAAMTVTDIPDRGLAYLDCVSITPEAGAALTTSITGSNNFAPICTAGLPTSPVVSTEPPGSINPADPGRKVVFTFGNVTNADLVRRTLTLRYRMVVLDISDNIVGRPDLLNGITWSWASGSLQDRADTAVRILEPKLTLDKSSIFTITTPGSEITFVLTIQHSSSTTNAYDLELIDTLPYGLSYVPASMEFVSGEVPTSMLDADPRHLRFLWDALPLGLAETVVRFRVIIDDVLPGTQMNNSASLSWTSLPGNPGQQSVHNIYSTERRYDPLGLNPVDAYHVTASDIIVTPTLPGTGFAPGLTTRLPEQPLDYRYYDLNSIRLEIPSLNVNDPIVGIPATNTGWDVTWLSDEIGWLEGTAFPSWSGNAVLTAHVYLPNGQPGPFVNLHDLQWGHQIIIEYGEKRYIYEVRQVSRIRPNNLTSMRHEDAPWLTLITCQGYNPNNGSYRYRIVVRAVLIDVQSKEIDD